MTANAVVDEWKRPSLDNYNVRGGPERSLGYRTIIGRDDGARNLKKEDREEKTDEETKDSLPESSPAPSQSPGSPSKLPTTTTATLSPTQQEAEIELLPFSLLIHGSLSLEDELDIRQELREFLLKSFRKEKDGFETNSIDMEILQMVKSYIPNGNINGKENSERDEQNPKRGLRRISGGHRNLQVDWSASTTSTLLEYHALAIGRFDDGKEECGVCVQTTMQQNQVEALENTDDLQEHFLNLFAIQYNNEQNQNSESERPVVLMEIRVADRPPKGLNLKETWKTIESIAPIGNFDLQKPSSSDTTDTTVASVTADINEKKDSNQKVIIGLGCTIVVLAGLAGLVHTQRKKTKNSSEGDRTNDIGNKTEVTETNVLNTSTNTGINTSFDSSKSGNNPKTLVSSSPASQNCESDTPSWGEPVINLTIPAARNATGFQPTQEERSSKSPFTFSPLSLFQNSSTSNNRQKQQPDLETNESDSVAAKSNNYNASLNDDDSMMGYSLTSLNRDRNNNDAHHDDNNTIEDLDETLSAASSDSERRGHNPMIAGINKLFENTMKSNLSNNPLQDTIQIALQMKSRHNGKHEGRSMELSQRTDHKENEGEPPFIISKSFDTDDEERMSLYNEEDVANADTSSEVLDTSSAAVIGNDFVCNNNNNHKPVLMPNNVAMVHTCDFADDASDAPSDERNGDSLPPSPARYTTDHNSSHISIKNSNVLENDPAVVDYLAKEQRRRFYA